MADAESPERLPVGWTEQVTSKDGKEVKFYYNVITGQTYSKADLNRYVDLGSPSQGTRRQTLAQHEDNSQNRLMLMPAETNNNPDWLPQGWVVELNATSTGIKYKRYIDPSTGRKFNSKPDVLRYLNSNKADDPMPEQTAISPHMAQSSSAETPPKKEGSPTLKGKSRISSQKERGSNNSRQKKVEIVRYTAEGLPPGWIKEMKIEKTGKKIRKDPFYTDPDSKYVFRSYPDALRYVETKDLTACATKPRKREELEFLSDDISILGTEEYTEKKGSHVPTSNQPCSTPGSKRKRGRPPAAAPSAYNITQQEKSAEVTINSTKSKGQKVIPEEAAAGDNGAGIKKNGYDNQQQASRNVGLRSFSNYTPTSVTS